MPQLAHVDVGDQPVDLTDGLTAGCYVAQVAAAYADIGDQTVLYATAAAAPSDDGDYFRAGLRDFFTFVVGDDVAATWAKTSTAGLVVPVALALVPS